MIARPVAAACAAALCLAPAPTAAQSDVYTRMSLSTSQIFDANLFATPAARRPQADLITRIGPIFEGGYLAPAVEIEGRYEIQAERYAAHPALNAGAAYRSAGGGVRYRPTPRLAVSVSGTHLRTQTPAELNLHTQLSVARAPARSMAVRSTAAFDWNEVTTLTAAHTLGRDELIGTFAAHTTTARVGIARRTSERSTYHAGYELWRAGFDGGPPVTSHVFTVGRGYAVTPQLRVDVAAGPRISDGAVRPEVTAALSRRLSWGEVALTWSRTELTAVGERAPIDVHRLLATAAWRATRRLTLTVAPAYTQHARGDRRAPVSMLEAGATYVFSHQLSLAASARAGRQHGLLSGSRDVILSESLAVRLLLTLPRRAGGDGRGRSTP